VTHFDASLDLKGKLWPIVTKVSSLQAEE